MMKTLFVVSDRKVNKHAGEEYDVILEVADQPTTDNIQSYGDQIQAEIVELWNETAKDDPERKVVVYLDAATPFAAMLENLQIILKARSGIVVELPWMKPVDLSSLDKESKKVLRKLEGK